MKYISAIVIIVIISYFGLGCDDNATDPEPTLYGIEWRNVSLNQYSTISFKDIFWNGTHFIAVGGTSTDSAVIMLSSNGEQWTRLNIANANSLNCIYGNGSLICAAGDNGTLFTSPDGNQWVKQTTGIPGDINGIVHGGNKWVAVDDISGDNAAISINGSQWTEQYLNASEEMNDVTYFYGLFIAVGWSGQIFSSGNGIDWDARESNTSSFLRSIDCNNDLIIATGSNGAIVTSVNGTEWAVKSTDSRYHFQDVTYANSIFVAAGINGLINRACIFTGTGSNWQLQNNEFPGCINGVAGNSSKIVAVGNNGLIMVSP